MKKKTILTLAAVATALGLTACGSQNDETAQLKEQVAQLEQQVEDLQSESPASDTQDVSAPSAEDSAAAEDTSDQNTPSASTEDTQQKSAANTPNLSVLSELVQDLEQRIKDAAPTGSAQEQREQFYNLKGEIDLVENELDALEDDLEAQYHSGSLDASSYQDSDRQIDALEDQLDRCEDQLELIFGIDG